MSTSGPRVLATLSCNVQSGLVGPTQTMIVWIARSSRTGKYFAYLRGEQYSRIKASREPLLAISRALLSAGFDPKIVLISRHLGSCTDCLSGKIEDLARLTVDESRGTRFARWKPFSSAAVQRTSAALAPSYGDAGSSRSNDPSPHRRPPIGKSSKIQRKRPTCVD
jgi:hypothetical protein